MWRAMTCAAILLVVSLTAYAEDKPRPVFGLGPVFLTDDPTDYEVSDGTLYVTNNSELRALGAAGFMFPMPNPEFSAIATAQFGTSESRALDGFLVGLAYNITDYLSIGFGYGIRLGHELAPGFDASAKANNPDVVALYVDPGSPPSRRQLETVYHGMEVPWLREDRVITGSYNQSLFVGLFVPVTLFGSD